MDHGWLVISTASPNGYRAPVLECTVQHFAELPHMQIRLQGKPDIDFCSALTDFWVFLLERPNEARNSTKIWGGIGLVRGFEARWISTPAPSHATDLVGEQIDFSGESSPPNLAPTRPRSEQNSFAQEANL